MVWNTSTAHHIRDVSNSIVDDRKSLSSRQMKRMTHIHKHHHASRHLRSANVVDIIDGRARGS